MFENNLSFVIFLKIFNKIYIHFEFVIIFLNSNTKLTNTKSFIHLYFIFIFFILVTYYLGHYTKYYYYKLFFYYNLKSNLAFY